MDFYDIIFDVLCLHGEEAAKSAAKMAVEELIKSKTEEQIRDRRDVITKECLARKEGA